jgi:hypothetical protein
MIVFHNNPKGMAIGEWFHIHFRRDYKIYVRFGTWSGFWSQPTTQRTNRSVNAKELSEDGVRAKDS